LGEVKKTITGLRFETVALDAAKTVIDPETGFLKTKAIITRTGIFEYPDQSIPGGIRREYRSPEEVFDPESMSSMAGIPITLEHPPTRSSLLDSSTVRKFQVGFTGDNIEKQGEEFLAAPLTVNVDEAIEAIKNGKRELSVGYKVQCVPCEGVYRGEKYTHIQKKIRGNHIAITKKGRAGNMARINIDSTKDAIELTENEKNKINFDKGKNLMALKVVNLDSGGIGEGDDALVSAYLDKTKKLADATAKLKLLKTLTIDGREVNADSVVVNKLAKLEAELENNKEKLEAKKDFVSTDALNTLVKDRWVAVDAARRVLDKKLVANIDEMSTLDIKKAVIVSMTKDDRKEGIKTGLDSRTGREGEIFINARFEGALENIPEKGETSGSVPDVNTDANKNLDEGDKAEKAYYKRLYSGTLHTGKDSE